MAFSPAQIIKVQSALNGLHFRPSNSVDGRYDDKTAAQVQAFRVEFGIEGSPASLDERTFRLILERVKSVQRAVAAFTRHKVTIDGRYDPQTVSAVEDFQRSHNLAVDGSAGRRTRERLKNETENLQNLLKTAGLYAGPVNGARFGEGLSVALRQFQEANRLSVNGYAGPRTMTRLTQVQSPLDCVAGPCDYFVGLDPPLAVRKAVRDLAVSLAHGPLHPETV